MRSTKILSSIIRGTRLVSLVFSAVLMTVAVAWSAGPTLNIGLDDQNRPVLRWIPLCGAAVNVEGRSSLSAGAWSLIPNSDLEFASGAGEVKATDKRAAGDRRFYRLNVAGGGLSGNKTLAAVDSPITFFEPDLAVDETYVYFGTSHGEIFRVKKDGTAAAERVTSVNVPYLLKVISEQNGVTLPPDVEALLKLGVLGDDLAVFGIAVDDRNIYFTVNKVLSVVQGDHPSNGGTENTDFHFMLPETGALFFIPKPGVLLPDAGAAPRFPFPMALKLDGAAGITLDETHLFWSSIGSQITDLEELMAWIAAQDAGEITNLGFATDTLDFKFRSNGAVLRRPKPTDQPQDWPLEVTRESEVLAKDLSLTSRNVSVDNTRVYFGEVGGGFVNATFGPTGKPSAVRSVLKSGGPIKTLFEATNNRPAFLISLEGNRVFFGGGEPIYQGGVTYRIDGETRTYAMPYFSFLSGIYNVPKTGASNLTNATVHALSIEKWFGGSPGFSITSGLKAQDNQIYFVHNYVADDRDIKTEGALRAADGASDVEGPKPAVLAGDLKRPSTFTMDDCAFYVTTHDKGTNSIVRISR